jgi:hypothetical protein
MDIPHSRQNKENSVSLGPNAFGALYERRPAQFPRHSNISLSPDHHPYPDPDDL